MSEQEVSFEVTLPADLVEKLDGLLKELGISSRSILIRNMLENLLLSQKTKAKTLRAAR
jgi:metal-responsive CopG/Arc/MetJ family transcriptional regulator